MKKSLLLILLSIFSFTTIHAEITWTLSDDGTLTISGTDMPDYSYAPWDFQRNKIKEVVIKDGVTSIGSSAFENCSGLTSVTIPNSVTSIGYRAFYGCSSLTSVTIPNSVTSIGWSAFEGTKWYDNQPDGVVYAGKVLYAYKGTMPSNTKIDIKDGTKGIGGDAFYACFGLTSITIPNSVTSIGDRAFGDCSGLTSVTIPNSVTSIGYWAFSGCSGLTSVTIPNSVTSIGSYAFYDCSGLSSITIPNSVTSIGSSAFSGTKWFDNQPDGVVYACKVLYAYKGTMPSNTKINIKEGTTGITDNAFSGCSGLTSITIPNSVTSIGYDAFYGCSGLTSVTIPNSVTSIGESAFENCSGLTSVTIGMKNMGRFFSRNSSLKTVTILDGVESIGEDAFYGCSGLTSVTIPNSVTGIGYRAFYGCSGLTSLTIPNSVTSIEKNAFYGCSGVKEIYSWNPTPPQAYSNNSFENMNIQHAKLFVAEGAGDAYKFAPGWMDFINIYEMEYTPVLAAADPITISDSNPSVTKGYYKEKTVTYVREGAAISKENYASFCLPFAVDPADAQFKAVYVPVGLSLYDTEANTLRIGFYQTDDIIPAGTPFLAQLAVDDKVEIKNALPVNYAPNAPAIKTSVVRTFNHSNSAGIMNENNDYAISFSGSYNKVSPANGYTFNTDGSIGASANVVPFRAYFVIGKNASNAKILTSFDIDAETTGIGQLRMTNNELPVYDMNGRRVNEKSLKSGIYIKNGKKYVK